MSSFQILILRLSSFGDIIQTLPTVDLLNQQSITVDYYTKPEFKYCTEPHQGLRSIYYYNKKNSFLKELTTLRSLLLTHQYDVIYDAHSNNRTYLFRLLTLDLRLWALFKTGKLKWIRRPKYRFKRFLFFKLRKKNVFPQPLIACETFTAPLIKKKVLPPVKPPTAPNSHYKLRLQELNKNSSKTFTLQTSTQISFQELVQKDYIIIAPSAAWPLKRWPTEYFQDLINAHPQYFFIISGGPTDDFAKSLQGDNVLNLVGQLNWSETGYLLTKAKGLIAADTGILHWGDYMRCPTIGLLGPTAFGQPFRPTTIVMNLNLPCSPCTKDGRGKCKIKETQKCLKDIKPIDVSSQLDKIISNDFTL